MMQKSFSKILNKVLLKKRSHQLQLLCTYRNASSFPVADNVKDRIFNANEKYETFIGLTDVKHAQDNVQTAESIFLESRIKERTVMRQLSDTREKLKLVREELSQVKYSSPTYLQLANKQHELVSEEEKLNLDLQTAEDEERTHFRNLSNAMRESYEKERIRVERTKNWSLIGTVFGGLIGMIGSVYINRVRTKELLKAVNENKVTENADEIIESLQSQQETMLNTLKSIERNVEKVGNEQEVQNLKAMAGFVNVNDDQSLLNKTGVQASKPMFNMSVIESMKDEMSNYNEALKCLVNSVNSLAEVKNLSSVKSSSNVETSDDALHYIRHINDQITSLHQFCAKDLQPTLSNIIHHLEYQEQDPATDNIESSTSINRLRDGLLCTTLLMCGAILYKIST